mmetsp:Transcript_42379/g.111542  ORF Transcript_42379/g.111542 Transcript_42379/m.111542 type:complete len:241 (-) Transcript_42379:2013-2735(-)
MPLDARAVSGAQTVADARHRLGAVGTAPALHTFARARTADTAPRTVVEARSRTNGDSFGAVSAGKAGSARTLAAHANTTQGAVRVARQLALIACVPERAEAAAVEACAVARALLLASKGRNGRRHLRRQLRRLKEREQRGGTRRAELSASMSSSRAAKHRARVGLCFLRRLQLCRLAIEGGDLLRRRRHRLRVLLVLSFCLLQLRARILPEAPCCRIGSAPVAQLQHRHDACTRHRSHWV